MALTKIESGAIANSAITTEKIANNAVTTEKIAPLAVQPSDVSTDVLESGIAYSIVFGG